MNNKSENKPLLIYDGDCGFCYFWVKYWHKLTGDKVNYAPYQEVEKDYPQISRKEFQSAVQYVEPNKKISHGAEASFKTISNAPGKSFWLWLYRYFPLFAFFSEKAYTFISTHRDASFRISLWLYGKNYQPERYDTITWIFIRLLGLIFLSAFISFGVQALGLIGSKGIVPVADFTNTLTNMMGNIRYWLAPMVFWLNSSDTFIQATCWLGAALSVLLIFNIFPRINLFLLYLLYLSLTTAGQVFMSFQWDGFLLETSILAIFLLSFRNVGVWLLRWLLFRFIFCAGLVKILSGDASWQAWTALYAYFATEPLPTPLAWYANQLPHLILQFVTAASLFIELIIPFLIFFPRRLRFVAGFAILLMQIAITLTGNYNFFNLLTMTLCLILFDDAAIQKIIPMKVVKQTIKSYGKISTVFVTLFVIVTVSLSIIEFQVRFVSNTPAFVWIENISAPLHIVNNYGPFAIITYPRNEIIVEGSDDGVNWKAYEFKYKPGDIYRRPPWNIPHQPRLDWQMWFAALSTPEQNPWFANFLTRLLENSTPVLNLLRTNPFPDHPPLYVRAEFYDYRFTNFAERNENGAWWKRELIGTYYPAGRLKGIFDH